jgi:hypothetical protein
MDTGSLPALMRLVVAASLAPSSLRRLSFLTDVDFPLSTIRSSYPLFFANA